METENMQSKRGRRKMSGTNRDTQPGERTGGEEQSGTRDGVGKQEKGWKAKQAVEMGNHLKEKVFS